MINRVEAILFRGYLNNEFRCSFIYTLTVEGKFKTVVQRDEGSYTIHPSYILNISEGYERPSLYISSRRFYQFITLLNKTVKVIQDNLYDIFPNVNRTEFEIDSRTLERFQTEQALSTAGMTMMPAVWMDSSSQCYPGIRIMTTDRPGGITIPLEDAIPFAELLHGFDANAFGINLLFKMGHFE